jgi:hypothetical protein
MQLIRGPYHGISHVKQTSSAVTWVTDSLTFKEFPDWIQQAQDRVQWQDFANMVMDLQGSIKGREFLDQLREHKLLKKDSAPWSNL